MLGDGRLRGGAARDEAPPDELGVQAAADGHRGATGVDRGAGQRLAAFLAVDFLAVVFLAVVFLAVVFLAGARLAVDFFRATVRLAVDFFAVVFFAVFLAAFLAVLFFAGEEAAVGRGAGRRAATGRPDADAGGQVLDPGLEIGQVDTHRLELLADLPLDEAHQVLGVLPTAGHQVLHGGLRLIDPELSGLLQVLRDLLGLGLGHLGEAQARVDEPLDEVVAGHLQQPTGIAPAVDDDAGGAATGPAGSEVSR